MPIKYLTLGLALLASGSVLAQHPAHQAGNYVVKNGENDWIIAHRHHLTVPQLHHLNPEIHWTAIHPGTHLWVSAHAGQEAKAVIPAHNAVILSEAKDLVSRKTLAKSASKDLASNKSKAPGTRKYTVKDGENDWIIAHRVGITTVALKRANPGVNVTRLRTGQSIRLPLNANFRPVNRIQSRYAVINGDDVNVRRQSNTTSELIAQVDSGMRVVVLDRQGEWYRLRFPHGTEGWVRGGLLKAAPEMRVAERRHHSHYVVSHSRRHSASSHEQYAERAVGGSRHHRNTAEPWAAADFSDNGEAGSRILQRASSFRGARYSWGSMSRSATDCSGFTSQVFNSEGFKIPRTSREQSATGQPVHAKDLKAGDLVFFHTMRGARVTHVGIYMGHGKFIHSSSGGGGVQVNRLDQGYYQHRLVGARRVAK